MKNKADSAAAAATGVVPVVVELNSKWRGETGCSQVVRSRVSFKTSHTCIRDTADLYKPVRVQMSATAIHNRELV